MWVAGADSVGGGSGGTGVGSTGGSGAGLETGVGRAVDVAVGDTDKVGTTESSVSSVAQETGEMSITPSATILRMKLAVLKLYQSFPQQYSHEGERSCTKAILDLEESTGAVQTL